MTVAGWILVGFAVCLTLYTYLGYPLLLRILAVLRPGQGPGYPPPTDGMEWPHVSITVPAYNEEAQIARSLDSLVALDYPVDRRQIVVVSDASTDRTDDIVRSYAALGVELVRQPERKGKTAAENMAAERLTGEIVVNTDASIRIHPWSLKRIVAPFADPTIGLASGRDVSVGSDNSPANEGEAGYVGYEMWIRDLETRVSGIVGASGCFYAIRRSLHALPLPDSLSRDFAAALRTREHGYRAVSVRDATCAVPRAGSLLEEYRRKVRTMTRGMETLAHQRALLDPFRYGLFAWMLVSHKICRWLVPWAGLLGIVGLAILGPGRPWAAALLGAILVTVGLGVVGWRSGRERLPRILALPAYGVVGNLAAVHAGIRVLLGDRNPIWEPTRRNS